MDNKKDNAYYIGKILSDLEFLIEHTKGKSQEEIENNPLLVDSIMFRLIQVAENNDKLTNDFKEAHKEVPWRAIKGMRNLIVHDYGIVDLSIVYSTVIESIPHYYELLKNCQ